MNAASVTPSIAIDRPGSYVLRLIVNDGAVSSAADTVTISTVNSAPVANAGADQTALVTQTVTLNGGGSSDVDGDALTFAWSFVSRPAGSSAVLSGAASRAADLRGRSAGPLPGATGRQRRRAEQRGRRRWTIQTVNSAPVANAGADQIGYVGQTVTLDGSGSTDVDGNALAYVWALTSRPAGSSAAIADPTAVTPIVHARSRRTSTSPSSSSTTARCRARPTR